MAFSNIVVNRVQEHPFVCGIAAVVVYYLARTFYRLQLHPLSKFPGPKFPAVTRWYEFYHQIVRGGLFYKKVDEMHRRYGPIVRINSFEVHINDPAFYDELFNFSPDLDKRKHENDTGNLQWTAEDRLHKLRRQPYNSFFSPQSIISLEGLITDSANTLCSRLAASIEPRRDNDLSLLFRCFLADNICDYAFGRNMGFLDDPKQGQDFFEFHKSFWGIAWLILEVPYLIYILMWLGPKLPAKGGVAAFASFQMGLKETLQRILSGQAEASSLKRRTIFHEYVQSNLPPHVKTAQGFVDDGDIIIGAGYETTGHALETATFHILANPEIHARLITELDAAVPSAPSMFENLPSWKTLEHIPYLRAVVQESLRISMGTSMRLPRVNNKHDMTYHDHRTGQNWTIPKGTVVSMTQRDVLYDKQVFPDPDSFRPDRWLEGSQEDIKNREKGLISFSKGSRGCLGKYLALAELYAVIFAIFRRFEMSLSPGVTRDCVEFDRDFLVPVPKAGEGSLRVKITGQRA